MIQLAIGLGPEHSDVITTGGQLLIALVGVFGAIQVALIQSGRKAAKNAAAAAETAVAQTVGNEADHTVVTELLEDLQAEFIRMRVDADERHRETRADIGGIREELRTERAERHQLAEYVIDNLPTKETP